MKTIVFLMSSYSTLNTGVGGHYRSLKEIVSLLEGDFHVRVFTYGDVPSPVLATLDCYRHVEAPHVLNPRTWRALRKIRTEPDIRQADEVLYISVGDLHTYVPILFCLGLGSGPVALVKPGGPMFNHCYMFNGLPLMVFQRQDYNRFAGYDSDRPLMMAPGRVSPPPYDDEYLRVAVPRLLSNPEQRLRLLTICRVAEEKSGSLAIMYGALAGLGSQVSDLESVHIGILQSRSVLEDLERYPLGFSHQILVADEVVDTAARAAHACDLFVGLGRCVMEAMALGKVAFVPVNDHHGAPRLVAVTPDNWRVFQNHNFTDRTPIAELEACGDVIFIEDVVAEYGRWQVLGAEGHRIFEEHLSIRTSATAWREFYDRAVRYRTSRLQDLARLLYFLAVTCKRQLIPIKR